MSWAEIKKAVNSDIDVPLDKYLNGNELKIIHNDENIPNVSSKTYTKPITITGSGLLFSLYVKMDSQGTGGGDYIDAYFEIDGNEIHHKIYFYSSDNRNGIFCINPIVRAENNTYNTPYPYTNIVNNNNQGVYIPVDTMSSGGTYGIYGGPNVCAGTILNAPLVFHNKVEITTATIVRASANYVNCGYGAVYSLLD